MTHRLTPKHGRFPSNLHQKAPQGGATKITKPTPEQQASLDNGEYPFTEGAGDKWTNQEGRSGGDSASGYPATTPAPKKKNHAALGKLRGLNR